MSTIFYILLVAFVIGLEVTVGRWMAHILFYLGKEKAVWWFEKFEVAVAFATLGIASVSYVARTAPFTPENVISVSYWLIVILILAAMVLKPWFDRLYRQQKDE